MNREHIIAVLYDLALVIGSEVRVKPLLTRTLQRLLYHTSFPTGLVLLDLPDDDGCDRVSVRLDAAVGDYELGERIGQCVELPAALVRGKAALDANGGELLRTLLCEQNLYRVFLRLPVGDRGVILLLAPEPPHTQLPLAHVFQPILSNLARAIQLCRYSEGYVTGLTSERDLAREALVDSEERFRLLTNMAPEGIAVFDDQGRVAYWNQAAERIFGHAAADAIGQDAQRLIAPSRSLGEFGGPAGGGTAELTAVRKDGTEFPVELSASSLKLQGRWHTVGILRDITTRKQAEADFSASQEKVRQALLGTVHAVALTAEKRDAYTAGHQQRVSELAVAIGQELGLAPERIEGLRLGGLIHDLGKVSIPSEILNRSGRLSPLELALVRTHPAMGYEIVKDIPFPWPVAEMVHQHHERLDGSGYPQGLVGGAIHQDARVIAVADVVEAMSAHRPYRPSLGIAAALGEIRQGRTTLYDPDVVDACTRVIEEGWFQFGRFPVQEYGALKPPRP